MKKRGRITIYPDNKDGGDDDDKQFKKHQNDKSSIASDWSSCPICYEVMILPTMFPCGHTFCRVCYFRLVFDGVQCKTNPEKVDIVIKCAVCKQAPRSKERIYPINYSLRDVIWMTHGEMYDRRLTSEKLSIDTNELLVELLLKAKDRFTHKHSGSPDILYRMAKQALVLYNSPINSSKPGVDTSSDLLCIKVTGMTYYQHVLTNFDKEPTNLDWLVIRIDDMFISITHSKNA